MVWLDPQQAEQNGPSVVAEGIFATTLIATPQGWRLASDLRAGAHVLTFDSGSQPVSYVQALDIDDPPCGFLPVLVPAWAMDNREDLMLLPEQKVLIEADLAEELYGDPFALIPARALEGWRGIGRCRPPQMAVGVQLRFAQHQVIYASRGVLLSCGGEEPLAESNRCAAVYNSYPLAQAQHLMACLMAEETGAALRLVAQRRSGSET